VIVLGLACGFLMASSMAPALAGPVTLTVDTPVKLRLEKQLRSGREKKGEPVPFSVSEAVTAEDGTVLIAAGAKAVGEITRSRGRGGLGRSGKLAFEFRYVEGVDGTRVPVRAYRTLSADSKKGAVIATAILLTPLTLFIKGKDVVVQPGREFEAYVAEDTQVDPSRRPTGVAAAREPVVGAQPLLIQDVCWFTQGDQAVVVFRVVNPNAQFGLRRAGLTVLALDAAGKTVGLNAGLPPGEPANTIYCLAPNEIRTFAKQLSVSETPARCEIQIADDWIAWTVEDAPEDLQPAVELADGHVRGQVQNTAGGTRDAEVVALVKESGRVVGAGTGLVRSVAPGTYAQMDIPILGQTAGLLELHARCVPPL
jgi:hypothetical protein